MSLPHVLLGLLWTSPSTGYDLARSLDEDVAPLWRAEISQIYPALARLRRAGFILLRVLGPRRGPRRNLYRITAAGRRELKRWLSEPSPAPSSKDEGLTRIAFLEALPPAERRALLARYERTIAEEIRRLRDTAPPDGFLREARRGAIERLEATRRWVRGLAGESTAVPATALPASPQKKR
ncbi:MAG: PadR family transcriptional regulator [Acidobacteriota bacterium]|nr:PadR family transcriptional regulator [Acidobacteriota bacterium]